MDNCIPIGQPGKYNNVFEPVQCAYEEKSKTLAMDIESTTNSTINSHFNKFTDLEMYLGKHILIKKEVDEKDTNDTKKTGIFGVFALKEVYVKYKSEKKTENIHPRTSVPVTLMQIDHYCELENYQKFWGPADINLGEDYELYKKKIEINLEKCSTKDQSDYHWFQFQQEIKHVVLNKFLNRLKACFDAIESKEQQGSQEIAAVVLSLTQYTVKEGNYDMLDFLLHSDRISNQLGFDVMSYVMMDKELSVLHMAIINQQMSFIKYIFQSFDNKRGRYKMANKTTQSRSLKTLFQSAEIPLNLAVWIGNLEIIKYLIENGAEMCSQDTEGYNCFHMCILLARDQPDKAHAVFEVLMGKIPDWIENTVKCSSLRDMCPAVQSITSLYILFKARTKHELTVLTMAAAVGSYSFLKAVLNIRHIYKQACLKMGTKSLVCYDASEVDPLLAFTKVTEIQTEHQMQPSILELLAFRYDEHSLQCIQLPIIRQIAKLKSAAYNMFVIVYMLLHVCFMITYTTSAYWIICPYLLVNKTLNEWENDNKTDDQNSGVMTKEGYNWNETLSDDEFKRDDIWIDQERFRLKWIDYIVIFMATVYLFYFCAWANAVRKISKRCSLTSLNEVWKYSSIQIQTVFLCSISMYLYIFLKLISCSYEAIALSLSFLIGWLHCIIYTRLLRSLGFFTIMLQRILLSDVLRFLFIICIISLAYAMAVMVMYATEFTFRSDQEGYEFHHYPWYIMFDFFRLGLDIADYTRLLSSQHEIYATALYITFVILCNILLFNLLIAAMNKRYGDIGDKEDLYWQRARLADIVIFEWIAPWYLKKKYMEIYKKKLVKITLETGVEFQFNQYLLDAQDFKNFS